MSLALIESGEVLSEYDDCRYDPKNFPRCMHILVSLYSEGGKSLSGVSFLSGAHKFVFYVDISAGCAVYPWVLILHFIRRRNQLKR